MRYEMKKWYFIVCVLLCFIRLQTNDVEPIDVHEQASESVIQSTQDNDIDDLSSAELVSDFDLIDASENNNQDDLQDEIESSEIADEPQDEENPDIFLESQDEILVDEESFEEPEYLLDALRAIVMTVEGTELVMQSDLERPALTGQVMSLEDRVAECCFYLDAVKQKAVATEDQIDRYLSAIQRDNNITLDDLKRTFEANDLTYAQAREQLGRMQTVNTIVELRVMSNVIVPRKNILAYYEENTPVHEAIYYLQRAVIPFEYNREVQRERLLKSINAGEENGGLRWSMVFSLAASDIAGDKTFIRDAELNRTIFGDAGEDGFELYRVIDKKPERVIPIDECYAFIERTLRQPLYEKLMEEYKEKLFERMTIVYI